MTSRTTLCLTLAAVTLASCAAAPRARAAAQSKAYVLTTDFSTGSMSVMDLSTRAVSTDVASVFEDAQIRVYNGLIYVINRYGQDNIQVIDPMTYTTLRQFSVGPGSNPQDIAFVSPIKAYVSLYERSALQICNPSTGALGDTISLAQFADADHLPEMAKMRMVGTRLLVAIQRLDRLNGYVPAGPGLVAVIDTQADTVLDVDPATPGVQAIQLVAANPVTDFIYVPGTTHLWMGCAGTFGVLDGGIEEINTATLKSDGLISTEAQLGGDIGDVEWYSATHSYAIVSDASYNSSLVSFDPTTGAKLATVRSPGGFSLPACAVDDRGEVIVADNGVGTAGLYVYAAGTDAFIAGPLGTGLPPAVIAFDNAGPLAGVTPPGGGELALAAPAPNPAHSSVAFSVHLPAASRLDVSVYDLGGRKVATLVHGDRTAGDLPVAWSLVGAGGRRVRAGVYVIRADAAGVQRARRVVVL